MGQVLLLTLVMQLFVVATHYFLQLSINRALPGGDRDLLLVLALGFAGFTLISVSASVLRGFVLMRVGASIGFHVASNLARHMLRLPISFFERRSFGDVLSRFEAVEPIQRLLTSGAVGAVVDGGMALVTLALMGLYSPLLAGLEVAAVAAYVAVRALMFPAQSVRGEAAIIADAEQSSLMIETLRGIVAVRLFGREDERHVLWQNRAAPLRGEIQLEGATYRYAPGERAVLDGLDLHVSPGEHLAITGTSGGGRTTLLKILLGLVEPEAGRVLVDGRALDAPGIRGLRRQVATVLQDDVLFAGSLADNIAFLNPEVDRERVERCARLAAVHEETESMPMRYETLVGDMGAALSGGQRQRVLLERALYRGPRILFMDEGTAHLDAETERAVNAAVTELGITRIVVAHRRETIRAADRVLELTGGRLLARSEGELLNSDVPLA